MPAILKVCATSPAPPPDIPFQGTFKTSLCTLRKHRLWRMGGFAAGKEALTECRRAVPTARSPGKGKSGAGACALESESRAWPAPTRGRPLLHRSESRAWPAPTRGGPLLRMAVRGAALAVHPLGPAARIVFFFPDRQTHFGFVDYVAAGIERLASVR